MGVAIPELLSDFFEQVLKAGLVPEQGQAAHTRALARSEPPDGLFAVNDPVAIGAIQALQQAGLYVPADVAVIGFSAAQWGEWVSPPLSSVRQPATEMGRHAAKLLLKQMAGEPVPTFTSLEGELLLRASSQNG